MGISKRAGADQMSFCWKTPEGYLFVSQQQGLTATEVEREKKKEMKGELLGIERKS